MLLVWKSTTIYHKHYPRPGCVPIVCYSCNCCQYNTLHPCYHHTYPHPSTAPLTSPLWEVWEMNWRRVLWGPLVHGALAVTDVKYSRDQWALTRRMDFCLTGKTDVNANLTLKMCTTLLWSSHSPLLFVEPVCSNIRDASDLKGRGKEENEI